MTPIQQILLGAGGAGENYWIGVFGSSDIETDDYSPDIAIDSSQNVYITTISYGQYSVTNKNPSGILFKYDKTGNLQWQRSFHVGGGVYSQNVGVDNSGDVYVSGYTGYGAGSGQSANNFWVAKFNSSGTLQWSRSIGTSYQDYCRAMAIDGSNNIFLLGQSPARTAAQVGSSWTDMCLVKYNSLGTFQNSYYHGDNGSFSSGWTMDADSSGNYYICGYLSGYGTTGIYVAKFNSSHSPQWRRHLNISNQSTSCQGGIAVDSSGNSYIVGDTNSGSTGTRDIFITKLNSNGATSWQRLLGIANRTLNGRDVTVDNSGNVYILGKGSVDYQGPPISPYTSTMDTIIIAKYNNSGSLQWKRFLGVMISPLDSGNYTDVEQGRAITVDPSGKNLYICGQTNNGNFGYGSSDCLFAKLPTDGTLTGTYSGGFSRNIIYGDASNLTDKNASINNDSYTSGYGTLSMNAYSNDSVDASFTGTLSQTTIEIS